MPSKLSSREKKCRLCFSKKIKQVLDLGSQPLANNLIKNKNKKEKKFPLKVFFVIVVMQLNLAKQSIQEFYLTIIFGLHLLLVQQIDLVISFIVK